MGNMLMSVKQAGREAFYFYKEKMTRKNIVPDYFKLLF